jgi:hypothetical protein
MSRIDVHANPFDVALVVRDPDPLLRGPVLANTVPDLAEYLLVQMAKLSIRSPICVMPPCWLAMMALPEAAFEPPVLSPISVAFGPFRSMEFLASCNSLKWPSARSVRVSLMIDLPFLRARRD